MAARFPPLWSVEDIGAAFVVRDANGHRYTSVSRAGEPLCPPKADIGCLLDYLISDLLKKQQ
jgi:hypothetical protein